MLWSLLEGKVFSCPRPQPLLSISSGCHCSMCLCFQSRPQETLASEAGAGVVQDKKPSHCLGRFQVHLQAKTPDLRPENRQGTLQNCNVLEESSLSPYCPSWWHKDSCGFASPWRMESGFSVHPWVDQAVAIALVGGVHGDLVSAGLTVQG